MMLETKERRIDLKLPTGWNQCSTEQLEMIAVTVLRNSLMQDRYHPLDWDVIKAELFFAFTGITVEKAAGDDTFLVRQGKEEPFPLEIWQVHSMIENHLKWIDDDKAQPLLVFPYKELVTKRRWPWQKKEYVAPGELLQDFSWEQFRHLQDYMELYIRLQNQVAKMKETSFDEQQAMELITQMRETRNRFLYVLFTRDTTLDAPHKWVTRHIGDVRWQVLLFWWAGFMRYLQQKFPRCFKQGGGKNKRKTANPLELYIGITATMQKYLSLDEEKVNAQTFYLTLEQLERIAKENEEIERMNKKHK